jgi:hypothetical protein
MVEQLTQVPEWDRFTDLVANAQELYQPGFPPMSPITTSFFSSWAFFDACIGVNQETLGTLTLAVGKAFQMNEELLRVIDLMQKSRMGVYIHEGMDGDFVVLRELVTNRVCRSIVPAGYLGHAGELWFVRVLPPALPEYQEHVVFTTPIVLYRADESDWQAYFDRTLPREPLEKRIAAYERHMKWGTARNFWSEYVFEAYANFQSGMIWLLGFPDIAESRPHSAVNS